jgi:uncharacterized membrane protein YeaQ/YmgE (transglycosylase-associated protein family)
MLHSIIIPIAVLLLALGGSYAVTRPIGDLRRHIVAVLVSLALGFVGAVIGDVLQRAAFETALAISIIAAVLGGIIGMVLAWRRRNPGEQPQSQSKSRPQSSRSSHYHGIGRA